MTTDRIRQYYDRTARLYDLTRLPFLPGRRVGVEALDVQDRHRVLEIGAGTGHNAAPILARIGSGSLTLLDLSAGMLETARRKRPAGAAIRYVASDACNIPLTTTYDRILFSYSLSLMPDPSGILETTRRLLKPNGAIVVVDFGPMSGWGPARSLARWWLSKHSVRPLHPDLIPLQSAGLCTIQYLHLGYTLLATISA